MTQQSRLAPLSIECFSLGVDGSLFHPGYPEKAAAWRFALDIPAEAVVLLSPRGWSRSYGQPDIMQAFVQAYPRLDRPAILIFMGLGRIKQPEKLARDVLNLAARQRPEPRHSLDPERNTTTCQGSTTWPISC